MNLYTCEAVSDLIARYIDAGGEIYEMREGVLGHGDLLLYDLSGKLKTIIIREVATNEWSCAHTIRAYNRMPNSSRNILQSAGMI